MTRVLKPTFMWLSVAQFCNSAPCSIKREYKKCWPWLWPNWYLKSCNTLCQMFVSKTVAKVCQRIGSFAKGVEVSTVISRFLISSKSVWNPILTSSIFLSLLLPPRSLHHHHYYYHPLRPSFSSLLLLLLLSSSHFARHQFLVILRQWKRFHHHPASWFHSSLSR